MLKLSESSWGVEEPDAIIECLRSDRTTMGEKVQKFENDFSEWNGSKYALMVNSGSSANLLIASTLSFLNPPQKNRNTVIVPALSWSTTYFPWIQAGYKLKFVDINLDNFNIDINILKTKISSDVIGICVPHILGQDAGLSEIKKISEEYGIWFIEDTCESLGGVAQINGIDHKLGTLGLAGTFSFFRSHHISTMEGGMLITNNPDVYAVAKSIRAHGWSREVPQNKYLNNLNGNDWEEKFKFYAPGYNLRPLELSGAVGIIQLQKLDKFLIARRSNAALLKKLLGNKSKIKLQDQTNLGSWMAFSFLLERDLSIIPRKELIAALEEAGIETRPVVTGNFMNQPVMKIIRSNIIVDQFYPNAEIVDKYGFMIANHGRDLTKELESLVEIFRKFKLIE